MLFEKKKFYFVKNLTKKLFLKLYNFFNQKYLMSKKTKKNFPSKKNIKSAEFEAKEQFTQSALENLTKENDLLIKNLKKAGEIQEEVA